MSQSGFKNFPNVEVLLEWYSMNASNIVYNVNNHIHSPYSFSAFRSLKEAFEMARNEKIGVLGINDFNTTEAYEEFNEFCIEHRIFPCFNIEFMGLLKDAQKAGIRVNDPINAGRTYLSGKGLDFPTNLTGNSAKKLKNIKLESAIQAELMLSLVSEHLKEIDPDLELSKEFVYREFTLGMLRERHIARAVREVVYRKYTSEAERIEVLTRINGIESDVNFSNHAAVENEIRIRLMKSGGIAYVKEDIRAFLEIEEIIRIIHDSGGIPTYPVLLDDKEGNLTEFEKDMESLHHELSSMNIYSIELIPGRNSFVPLRDFVRYFHDRNFIISFGTEHNTSSMIPLKVSASKGEGLDEYLKRVSFEAVCVIAAHQYYRAKGQEGYIERNGRVKIQLKDEFIETGNAVIEYFLKSGLH